MRVAVDVVDRRGDVVGHELRIRLPLSGPD
jgi:hypothetical protein